MDSKQNSDKARLTVNTLLLDKEVSAVLRKIKGISQVTYEHSLNVAFLTAQILLKMRVPGEEYLLITEGALLHDIGKLMIPNWILEKKGFLSDEELIIMKKHPESGELLLKSEFMKPQDTIIVDIVSKHHEKYDGKGYPNRLKKNDVPWYVYLVSSVDAYEAITAERNYGKSHDKEDALKILENSGFSGGFLHYIDLVEIN